MEFCKVTLTFVCGRNPMMWPFKWKLSACTFTWCYLFLKILENEIWKFGRNFPLATFGSERVNKGPHAQLSQKGIKSGRRKWPLKAHVKIIFGQLFHGLLSRYVIEAIRTTACLSSEAQFCGHPSFLKMSFSFSTHSLRILSPWTLTIVWEHICLTTTLTALCLLSLITISHWEGYEKGFLLTSHNLRTVYHEQGSRIY